MSTRITTIKIGITRCYLIQEKGTILIDSGMPNGFSRFQKIFQKLSIPPHEVRLIVLTHGDVDHVGSARELKTWTGAQLAIHSRDRLNLEHSLYNFPPGVTLWGRFLHLIFDPILRKMIPNAPPVQADLVLGDEEVSLVDYGISGKVIYTPGHTLGSVSVLLETGEIFVGCLAHNAFPFRLTPGLPIFAKDLAKVKESWRMVIRQGAQTIYPAHGKPFSVEVIKKLIF